MDIVRRGYVPQDAVEFGPKYRETMERASVEVDFLINRGYDIKSASTFVGNHYMLSERQRMALARMRSPEDMIKRRRLAEIDRFSPPPSVVIDGFNLIVTLEVAFSGSLLIGGADGTVRDLAGLRGTYRIVDKTGMAVSAMFRYMKESGIGAAKIYLDQPVSNSGRLAGLIREHGAQWGIETDVELRPDVDRALYGLASVVTTDAIILNHCLSWYNMARWIIERYVPEAWVYRLE
ncbi:MAG: DUF434 domain-containing protein [Enterocloster asparagiformis]|nr:DUF434 domain-containing protein [Enterocloster asparagiformis]